MIIDFTFENFRSFRDSAMLSMSVENPKNHLPENVSFPLNDKIGVLKTTGIYGANASGKSNVLLALRALQWLVESSGDLKEDSRIPCYEPFLLDDDFKNQPIKFDMEFVAQDKLRYQYSISFSQVEILEESLDFFPSRQKANLFKRTFGETWENISFGSHYKGGTKRIPFFKNNSYLSKAGNNAGASNHIRMVYGYFRSMMNFNFNAMDVVSEIYDDDELLGKVSKLLSSFDTGIVGISKKENKSDPLRYLSHDIPDEVRTALVNRTKYDFLFAHEKSNGGTVNLRQGNESEGTQKLFTILPAVIAALELGAVLVMDEIDASFHPHIAGLIVQLFNNPDTNCHHAQLIFSTHNINLMSNSFMRRDQVWFAQKASGASKLYSLDEFDKTTVKSNSPFGQWYDEGRFGAVPSLDFKMVAELLSDHDDSNELETISLDGGDENA